MKKGGLFLLGLAVMICINGMACSPYEDEPEKVTHNRVTSPSGGTWILGEDRSIEWEADKNDPMIGTLCIQSAEQYTYRDGVISSTVPVSSGSFNWRVGVLESGIPVTPGNYRIVWRITEGPNWYSFSGHSGVFAIKSNR